MEGVGERDGGGAVTKFRELPSTVVGQLGEQIVAREYRRDGWGVIASYKFSGTNDNEAPAIEIDDGAKEITPDLDVSKGGRRIWIEVKTHAIAAPNHKLGFETHGIAVRLFDNYTAVEHRSGNPVFLAIVQLDTREILVSPRPLSRMMKFECLCGCHSRGQRPCSAGPSGRYPQWYFRKDDFEIRGHVDDRAFRLLDEKHRVFKGHTQQRHGTIVEKPPWTWCCLACNYAGLTDAHVCRPQDYMRDYWTARLRIAMPTATRDERLAIVTKPIARAELAKLLGDRWAPSNAGAITADVGSYAESKP